MPESHTEDDIYTSDEALDAYLAQVRIRLEQRSQSRREMERLRRAEIKVQAAYEEACLQNDLEIAAELDAVLAEFRRRLQTSITDLRGIADFNGIAEVDAAVDRPATAEETRSGDEHPAEQTDFNAQVELSADGEAEPCVDGLRLQSELNDLTARWNELDIAGFRGAAGPPLRSNMFRLRALACELAVIMAGDAERNGAGVLFAPANSLRERMELARNYAGDDQECPPFGSGCRPENGGGFSLADWASLAKRYARAADADDAFLWYTNHDGENSLSLLNSIAAAQQLLYRDLLQLGGRDGLQAGMYTDLRNEADSVGFLSALNPYTDTSTLEGLAGSLSELLSAAQRERKRAEQTKAKVKRRKTAIVAVVSWFESMQVDGAGVDASPVQDEALRSLLDECLAAGVAPTNPEVRRVLLEAGAEHITDRPPYAGFAAAVREERKRKGLDDPVVQEGEVESDGSAQQSEEFRAGASAFVGGKSLLILGGIPRQRTCDDLKAALGCADVRWLPSRKSDRVGKFQAEIRRADVLLLAKNFAGHDMSEKGREWIRSVGGHFIYLPSGYGVNQITYQLHEYASSRNCRS